MSELSYKVGDMFLVEILEVREEAHRVRYGYARMTTYYRLPTGWVSGKTLDTITRVPKMEDKLCQK